MSFQASCKQIKVKYFALLREERGLEIEEVSTEAQTLSQLYEELANRYRFSLAVSNLAVCQDESFAAWSDNIKNGSTVVFIPPVAGG